MLIIEIVLGIVVTLAVAFITFIVVTTVMAMNCRDDLHKKLPWRQWVTFAQLQEFKCASFTYRFTLSVMSKMGELETRLSVNPAELAIEEQEELDKEGFTTSTVKYHDVRVTMRGGRKKKIKVFSTARLAWSPASA